MKDSWTKSTWIGCSPIVTRYSALIVLRGYQRVDIWALNCLPWMAQLGSTYSVCQQKLHEKTIFSHLFLTKNTQSEADWQYWNHKMSYGLYTWYRLRLYTSITTRFSVARNEHPDSEEFTPSQPYCSSTVVRRIQNRKTTEKWVFNFCTT